MNRCIFCTPSGYCTSLFKECPFYEDPEKEVDIGACETFKGQGE